MLRILLLSFIIILASCEEEENSVGVYKEGKYYPLDQYAECQEEYVSFDIPAAYITQGCSAHDLLSFILDQKKGKKIVLDIWATWCKPCKRDFKDMKGQKLFWAANDIEFVYLATDRSSSVTKWINDIKKYELDAMHFYVEDATISELMGSTFGIKGFPSYIYIDENNIVKLEPLTEPNSNYYHPLARYAFLDSVALTQEKPKK